MLFHLSALYLFMNYKYLSKDRVIHQLEEILKGILGLLSLLCVEFNVVLQPWTLIEFNDSMNCLQLHTKSHVALQGSVVNYIFLFVV